MKLQTKTLLAMGVIIAAGLFLYIRTLGYGFINIDDSSYITGNPYLSSITLKNIYNLISKDFANMWSPVTMLFVLLEHSIWGNFAGGYHVVNLIFHIINTFLVFYLIGLFTESFTVKFITALFFLISPVQIESVAWVSEQKTMLSTFFLLLSVITYIKAREKNKPAFFSFIFFVFSVLSKVTAVIIPVILLFYEWIFLSNNLYKAVKKSLPYFAVSIIVGIIYVSNPIRINFVHPYGGTLKIHILTVLSNLAGITQYPVKILFPFYLHAIDYPDNPINNILSIEFLVTTAMLCILIHLAYRFYKRGDKSGLFFLGWYFINFSLGTGIIPIAYQGALRFLYVPLIGIGFFAGRMVEWFNEQHKWIRTSAHIAVVLIATAFIVIDVKYIPQWKNNNTFWAYQLKAQPDNPRDMAEYADVLMQNGDINKALALIKKAQSIGYNDSVVWGISYSIYSGIKDYKGSVTCLDRIKEIYMDMYRLKSNDDIIFASKAYPAIGSTFIEIFNEYAMTYLNMDVPDKADMYIDYANMIQPSNRDTFLIHSQLLIRQHKYEDVISNAMKYLQLKPDAPEAYVQMGIAYYDMGQLNNALQRMDIAINIVKGTPDEKPLMILKSIMQENKPVE
jgi:tetratricopeptide (TPR) repeat protein